LLNRKDQNFQMVIFHNLFAEITAIKMIFCRILVDFEKGSTTLGDIAVFSDSKSALQVKDRGLSTYISNMQQLTNQLLTSYGIDITS
jgi:hypothetical protein